MKSQMSEPDHRGNVLSAFRTIGLAILNSHAIQLTSGRNRRLSLGEYQQLLADEESEMTSIMCRPAQWDQDAEHD